MSVTKPIAARATSRASSTRNAKSNRRETDPAIERLEDRRLLAATISVVNPSILPGSNRLIFSYIQNPDASLANGVHSQQTLEIDDTGSSPLVISSINLSGPWAFVGAPTGGYSNVTVNPGTPLMVTLSFTQRTLPAHSTNETNFTSMPNGGAVIDGSLTIVSNDSVTPTSTVSLAGYWQNISANEEEPNLQTIVNTLAGYDTVIATASQLTSHSNGVDLQNNGSTPTYYGQEVQATSWEAADTSQPVTIQELAEYYIEGDTDTTYWYTASNTDSHPLMTSAVNQGQTVLPTQADGSLMQASFTPNGAFGLRVDTHYSNDALNTANGDKTDDGHRFRFYPLIDQNGNAVPNSWVVAVHEGTSLADYQDAVYVVSNMQPATAPPPPTALTASNAVDPVLNWTGINYSNLAGYNVYRSTSATGTFTELTSTPITATTYTDTNSPPSGETLYYQVTSVDSVSGIESAPATATSNTPSGPTATSFSVSAFTDQPVSISVLPHVEDATGTPTPGTLTITAPGHGTATLDTTNGLINYISGATFTGTDTLTYSISDSNGLGPSTGTITISVATPASIPPTASPQFGVTLVNTPVVLTPTALDSNGNTITPALVEIANTSADFTAVPLPTTLNTSTGAMITLNSNNTVTYTPVSNFVGSDSFLFKVKDSAGNFSTSETFTINVGVQISSAKGAAKSVVYSDAGGQQVTITLSKGIAGVYFNGNGVDVTSKGKISIAGTGLTVSNIAASQTAAASALALTTKHNAGTITLGGVTDTGTLGSITGLSANLAGISGSPTIVVGGVKSIKVKAISSANIQLGNTGVAADSLTVGAVTNSVLTSTATISQIKATSWANTSGNTSPEAVTAPVIKSLSIAGEFDPNLNLTGAGVDLNSAVVGGAVNKGLWNIAGSANSITVGSVGSQWGGIAATGKLSKLKIKTGGLGADVGASTINSIVVPGILSGNITTTGNLLSLQAAQLVGSLVDVGSTATSVAAATLGNLGTATLNSLKLTSKAANTFSDSNVIADKIGSVTLGQVNVANGGTPEGIAAHTIKSASLTLASGVLHLNASALLSESALQAFLSGKGASLGTLAIDIL